MLRKLHPFTFPHYLIFHIFCCCYLREFRAEFGDVGEVAGRQRVHFHHLAKHRTQVREQRVLLLLVPHHHRHLLLEVRHDVRVDLGEPGPLDQLVDFAHCRVAWQVAKVLFEVMYEEGGKKKVKKESVV